ncbi:MAG: cation-translocating P-type ATPase [Halobacteriales archaeon]|nr:cation-translocating P-type ATPase [Halobacteriales archaeon]
MTACTHCGKPTPDPPVTDPAVPGEFCCTGCLGTARDSISEAATPETEPEEAGEESETTYLGVSGMHCATCESFIERRAGDADGVVSAEASYPAGIVKLTYDPDRLAEADLPALIDGLGYTARDVEDREAETGESVGRLLVGGFFGMMVMLWYALFLYPTYLGVAADALLLDVTGPAGWYVLANTWVMTTVVLGYTGFPILRGAYVSLRARSANMDLLVSLAAVTAYVYSTIVLLTGGTEVYFDIAVVIVLAVSVGNHYESRIRRRAAGRLADLTEERVDRARRRAPDGVETVALDALADGDEVVVRSGERVPIDGTVLEGEAAVDQALVTGESLPEPVAPGDRVVGGARVVDGGLVLAVDAEAGSTLDRLTDLLWEVSAGRAGVQGLADRLAGVFVPLVVALAALAAVGHLLTGSGPTAAVLTGLAVLVVSCPCALGLATPLAVASGVSRALEDGIVVADGSVFERATQADIVAFDKTGTLTTGRMRVLEATGEELELAAAVEQFSDHPVAEAIVDEVGVPDAEVAGFERHPGRGVSARVDGRAVVVGRPDLLEDEGCAIPEALRARAAAASDAGRVPVLVGVDGEATGLLVAGDEPREGWADVVTELAADRRVVVITGDSEAAAAYLADHPGVDDVMTNVPPEGKTAAVEALREEGTVAMVGDGSNDAPALAAADVGIALEEGTRLAASAADAVIVTDDLSAVPRVFELTAATRRRIRENLGWAFLYNAVAVPLALLGLINPLFAAIAMATSSLLVVGNSARSLG